MTMDEYAKTTLHVIAQSDFDEFHPTACYPTRCRVMTLAGFPSDLDPEAPVLEWAGSSAEPNEEFLVAFKVDSTHFTVIRCVGTFKESETYAIQ